MKFCSGRISAGSEKRETEELRNEVGWCEKEREREAGSDRGTFVLVAGA